MNPYNLINLLVWDRVYWDYCSFLFSIEIIHLGINYRENCYLFCILLLLDLIDILEIYVNMQFSIVTDKLFL